MRLQTYGCIALATVAGICGDFAIARAQAPTISVGAVGYAQYAYQLKVDSSLAPPGHANNFDVTRAYLTVTGKFADGVGARVTADIDGRKAASNQLSYRLKYAYASWQPGAKGPMTFKLGMIQTPWIDWEESLFEYRFQSQMPLERAGYVASSDFGASADGMWNFDQVNMTLGIYNGENYNNALGDQRKDIEARLSVRLAKTNMAGRSGGLRATGYAQIGKSTGGGKRQRFLGMLSYKTTAITLGGQITMTQDSTNAAHPEQKGTVLAAYGVFNVPKSKFSLMGRVDNVDPNTDSTSIVIDDAGNLAANRLTRVIAGVAYTVGPNLRLLVDVDLNSLQNGATNAFDRTRQALYLHTEFKF
jgi:hypothetical protein